VILTRKEKIDSAESVHFFEKNKIIFSRASNVYIKENDKLEKIKVPISFYKKILSKFRIFRRLFRIDQYTIKVINSNNDLVIINNGNVYHYDGLKKKLTQTLRLRQSKQLLKDSICLTPDNELFFGEYGSNKSRKSVPIYRSKNFGKDWEIVYEIKPGKIRHIHGCYWDNYENKIWILTGDFKGENYLIKSDCDFKEIEWYGDGSQNWRACNLFFTQNEIYWITDSEFQDNYLFKMNREDNVVLKTEKFPGPVWYIKELKDSHYLLGITCENGPGSNNKFGYLYYSSNLKNWFEVSKFKKDFLPKKYFKNGVVSFSDGKQTIDNFIISGQGFKDFDGVSFQCEIQEPIKFLKNKVFNGKYHKDSYQGHLNGVSKFKDVTENHITNLLVKNYDDFNQDEIRTNEIILRFCEIKSKHFTASVNRAININKPLNEMLLLLFISNYLQSKDLRYLNIILKLTDILKSNEYNNEANQIYFKKVQDFIVRAIER